MADGTTIQAGNVNQVNHLFSDASFAQTFDLQPIVLTQTTTQNGGSTVTTRLSDVTRNGFSVKLQEQESADNRHSFENVSYIAIDRGTGQAGNISFDALFTGVDVTHQDRQVFFRSDFDRAPALFLSLIHI